MVYEIQPEMKNELYHKYDKITSVKNESPYKLFWNKLNHELKTAEHKHSRGPIIYHKDDTRKSWSIIKINSESKIFSANSN